MKKIVLIMLVIALILPSSLAVANNDFKVYVDGEQLNVNVHVMNGSTLVPLRTIFEAMNAYVHWDAETKTVLSTKDDVSIQLTIGSKIAKKNGQDVLLAIPAQIINSSTMVPLRFIGESFGGKVNYDASTKSIYILTMQEAHFMITDEPELDPQASSYSSEFEIMNNIYEGLIRIGPNQEYQNAMAESYYVSHDELTWTFKIRNALWNDGSPVTAHDFVYGLERAASDELNFPYSFIVTNYVKEAKALDDKTLVISLTKPTPYFQNLLTLPPYYPVKKDFVESKGESFGKNKDSLLFNGPFKVTKWLPDQKIVLEKNPNYWDAKNVKLEKVTLHTIKDGDVALNLYLTGQLDRVRLYERNINLFKNYPQFDGQFSSSTDSVVFWMELNNQNAVLKNANIRKALSWGFNRQSYVDNVLKNESLPAYGLVPPEMPGAVDETFREANGNLVGYDIEKAKMYLSKGLEELGLEKLPSLTYLGNTTPLGYDSAVFIKEMYSKVGIDISIQNLDFSTLKEKRKLGQYDLVIAGWGPDYWDPMTFLEIFTSNSPFNYGKWSSTRYNQNIHYSQYTSDFASRMEKLLEAERILIAEEAGIVPLYYRVIAHLTKPSINGFVDHPFGPDSSWKWISIEK